MKNVKNILIISGLIISSLAISPTVLADTTNTTETKKEVLKPAKSVVSKEQNKANKKAITDKAKSQTNLLAEVNKGVAAGLEKVIEATTLIKEGKEKEAIKALQDATGKFDLALAANPKLGLIPIASSVRVNELITTPASIKAQVTLVKELLDNSKVQAARAILAPLQDDMITRTTSLPMSTYPDAIKLATKMLVEGNKEAALETLATALSTFVNKISVIPLSLLRVESMVSAASKLDKEKEKAKVLVLLSAAEEQLQIATKLGYTTKSTKLYEDLSSQIAAIKKETAGKNIVENLYRKLKASVSSLIQKKSESNKITQ